MFDSIGWGEIFVVILAGLIIIGPERLPGVIMDVRAAIFAARRAINDAKNELYGEEFDEFRKPMSTVTEYAAMGPKRAIAKVLFDEEGDYLDQFDPRRMMEGDPVIGRNAATSANGAPGAPSAAGSAGSTGAAGSAGSTGAAGARGLSQDPGSTQAPIYSEGSSQPSTQPQPQSGSQLQSPRQQTPREQTAQAQSQSQTRRRRRQPGMGGGPSQSNPPAQSSGGGFSWADVT